MMSPKPFLSWLASDFERFVAVKRAGGAGYLTQRQLLVQFDRYVRDHAAQPPLTCETLTRWLASCELTPRARDNLVSVVWQALAHARRHGAEVEPLPQRPPRPFRYWRQRQPRIVSSDEIVRLMGAAHQLPPAGRWRGVSIATLLGLLYVTGMRIGEARQLNISDLDEPQGILTIRSGKFGKSRMLPLRRSTVRALVRYREHPLRPPGPEDSDPFFVSIRRRRLSRPAMDDGIRTAVRLAGLDEPRPRSHDLRHSYTVRQLARGYTEGRDLATLLPTLSTYLGHVCVENTRSYLVTNGSILEHAAQRFARLTRTSGEQSP